MLTNDDQAEGPRTYQSEDERPDRVTTLPEMAAEINRYLTKGHEARKKGLGYYWWAGFWLIEAKARVGHGGWGQWLKDNCEVSERQAQRYMKLRESAVTADLATEDEWRAIQHNDKPAEDEPEPADEAPEGATEDVADDDTTPPEAEPEAEGAADADTSEQQEPPELALMADGCAAVPVTTYLPPGAARWFRKKVRAALVLPGREHWRPQVRTITVEPVLTDEQVLDLEYTQLTAADYDPDLLLGGPVPERAPTLPDHVDVRTPDGKLVLALRRNVLPAQLLWDAQHSLFNASYWSTHRDQFSGTVGNFDFPGGITSGGEKRGPTAWTRNNPESWVMVQQLLLRMDEEYERWLPEDYQRQADATEGNPWLIPGTAFTTAQVNNTADFDAHRDDGDWPGAYSVQTVLRFGDYTGGHIVFPRYRLAADMGSGDLLFFKRAEMHGVTEFGGKPDTFARVSVVGYCRDQLVAEWAANARARIDQVDRALAEEEERWAEATAAE